MHTIINLLVFAIGLSVTPLNGETALSAPIPFQSSYSMELFANSTISFVSYDVPIGKRLIIKYVASWAEITKGEKLRFVIQTTLGNNPVDYRLASSSTDYSDGTSVITANQALYICADGGTHLILQIFRDLRGSSGKAGWAVSGLLVPAPLQ